MTPEALVRTGTWASPGTCFLPRKRSGPALIVHVAGSTPALQGGRRKRICRALGDPPAGKARRVEEGASTPSIGFRGWVPLPTIADAPPTEIPNAGLVAATKLVLGGLGVAAVVAAGFDFSHHLLDSVESFPLLANLELLVGSAVTARAAAGYFTNTASRTALDLQLSQLLAGALGAFGGAFKDQSVESSKEVASPATPEKYGTPEGARAHEDSPAPAEEREPTMLEVELRSLVDASAAAASEYVEREQQRPPPSPSASSTSAMSVVVVDRRVLVESMAQYVRAREQQFTEGHERLQQDLQVSEAIRTSLVQLQKSKARRAAVQARLMLGRPDRSMPLQYETPREGQLTLEEAHHSTAAQTPEVALDVEPTSEQPLTPAHGQLTTVEDLETQAGFADSFEEASEELPEESFDEAAEEASDVDALVWASISSAGAAEESAQALVEAEDSHPQEQLAELLSSADAGLFSEAVVASPHDPTREEPVQFAKGKRGFPGMQILASMRAGGGMLSFPAAPSSHGTPVGDHDSSMISFPDAPSAQGTPVAAQDLLAFAYPDAPSAPVHGTPMGNLDSTRLSFPDALSAYGAPEGDQGSSVLGSEAGFVGASSAYGAPEGDQGSEGLAGAQALGFLTEDGFEGQGPSSGLSTLPSAFESFSSSGASLDVGDVGDLLIGSTEGGGAEGWSPGDGNEGHSVADVGSADVSSLGSGLSALSLTPSTRPDASLESIPFRAQELHESDQEFEDDIAAAFERARAFRAKLDRLKKARQQRREQDKGVRVVAETPTVHLEGATGVTLPEAVSNPME